MPASVTSLCVVLWISVACRAWAEKPHCLGLGKLEQPCWEGSHLRISGRAGQGAAARRQAPGVLWLEWQVWWAPGATAHGGDPEQDCALGPGQSSPCVRAAVQVHLFRICVNTARDKRMETLPTAAQANTLFHQSLESRASQGQGAKAERKAVLQGLSCLSLWRRRLLTVIRPLMAPRPLWAALRESRGRDEAG